MYVDLLEAAEWDGAVGTLTPITVFAPTNAALQALGPDVLDEVRADPARSPICCAARSSAVSHRGEPRHDDVADDARRHEVTVSSSGGTIQVGSATVGGPEILADNGVIQPLTSITPPPR